MDETLATMLRAVEDLNAPSVADRVSALDSLREQLPQLVAMSAEEWDSKLTAIEEDVAELGDEADRATDRFEAGRNALETLKRFAEQHAAASLARAGQKPLFEAPHTDADGRYDNPIAGAETTRDAILEVMNRRPHREWSPTAIADDLARYRRPVERSNVQVTLKRLAQDKQVRKVGRGAYRLVHSPATPSDDEAARAASRSEAARKAWVTRRKKQQEGDVK